MKLGVQVLPEFTVVQHQVDEQVLYGLKDYFGCGVVRKNHGTRLSYRVRGHQTYFWKRFFLSSKNINLKHGNVLILRNFGRVILMMEKGEHLTPDGLEKIRQIKDSMNSTTFLKIESNYNGNISRDLSEIPCRVSSDPHERRNDLDTVSERGSVK
jgi:hypothetical protein